MASTTVTTSVTMYENTSVDFNLYGVLAQGGYNAVIPLQIASVQIKDATGKYVTASASTFVPLDLDSNHPQRETLRVDMTTLPSFLGLESLKLTLTDGTGFITTLFLGVNVLPVPEPDSNTIVEDTTASGNVLVNDPHLAANPLTVSKFTVEGTTYTAGTTAHLSCGDLVIQADGSYSFVPTTHFYGSVPQVTYTIAEATGNAATTTTATLASSTLNITVTPLPPVAQPDSQSVPENQAANGNVLGNDSDINGRPLSVTSFTVNGNAYGAGATAHLAGIGDLTVNADGSYHFAPAANYYGSVPTVNYAISDGLGSASSTLNLNVTPLPPVASPDSQTIAENSVAHGNVLANDVDINGLNLQVSQFSVAGQTYAAGATASLAGVGDLVINADGSYSFTPVTNYYGPVPVAAYTVADGLDTASSTLSINVSPFPPIAYPDSQSVQENGVAQGNVLNNDVDLNGKPLAVTEFNINGNLYAAGETANIAGVGSLTLNGDGSYSFTPAHNYYGPVPTVSYSVSDGLGTSTSTLSLSIEPLPPVAQPDSATVEENGSVTGDLLANDSDINGRPLHVTEFQVQGVSHAAGETVTLAGIGDLTVNADGSYSFTPAANYYGSVPDVGYTISDGLGSASSSLHIDVTPVGPQANNDLGVVINEPISGNVLDNDVEINGQTMTVTSFKIGDAAYAAGSTAHIDGVGDLVLNSDGAYTFTPVLHYVGMIPEVSYTMSDGLGSSSAVLTLVNMALPDEIFLVPDSNTVVENSSVAGNVLTNDFVSDTYSLTVVSFTVADQTYVAGSTALIDGVGSLTMAADGSYSFTPAQNYIGPVPLVVYTATDGGFNVDGTLTLDITPLPPEAVADSQTLAENTVANGNVLGNDVEINGQPLSVTEFSVDGTTYASGATASIAGVGSLVINTDGSYTFTPAANYYGPVPQVSYTINDGLGSASSTLDLTVTPVGPTAVADVQTVAEDSVASGNVLGNDVELNGQPLSVTRFSVAGQSYAPGETAVLPGIGSLVLNSDGSYSFTPVANWNGAVPEVSYTMADSFGSSSATLNLNVTPVNDAPVAEPEAQTIAEDTVATGNVLTNDSDVDGDSLSVTQFVVNGSTYSAGQTATIAGIGALVINADGSYSFTPVANWNGSVPVANYSISDGHGGVASSTLSITVTPVNDGPVAQADSQTVAYGTTASGNVLTNDSDVDGDALSVTQFVVNGVTYTAGQTVTLVNVGALVVNANGSYSFVPASGYSGTVPSVAYSISDGHGGTASSTLSITVQPSTNHAPTQCLPCALSTNEDTALNFGSSYGNGLSVADVDGGTLTTTLKVVSGTLTLTSNGGATLSGNGTATVTLVGTAAQINAALASIKYAQAVADWNGSDTLTVSTSDGQATTSNSVGITVNPVADIANDTATTSQNTAVTISVGANDTFENASHPITAINGTAIATGGSVAVTNGSVSLNSAGQLVFTPASNYTGSTSFTYTVTSGGVKETATVSVTVSPSNHNPNAVDDCVQLTQTTAKILAWEDLVGGGDRDFNDAIMKVVTNADGSVTVTLTADNAGYNNTLGYYVKDASGNPSYGKVIFADSDTSVGHTYTIPATAVSGKSYGFFLIADGGDLNSGLSDSATVYFKKSYGNWYATNASGQKLMGQGANIFFDDAQFNSDSYVTGTTRCGTGNVGEGMVHVHSSTVALSATASGNVLGNDTDVDHDTLTVISYTQAAHGSVSMSANGNFSYVANTGYTGSDSFTYTISDGHGGTDTATVSLGSHCACVNHQVTWTQGGCAYGKTVTIDLSKYACNLDGSHLHYSFDSATSGHGYYSDCGYSVQSFDSNTGCLTVYMRSHGSDSWVQDGYCPDLKFSVIDDYGNCSQGSLKINAWDSSPSSPIALDLNHNGQIDVTGQTTAKDGDHGTLGHTVQFDLNGDGQLDTIEWLQGTGDGLLADNRDGNAALDMNGTRLFGNDASHDNGYAKLAELDADHDGTLTSDELKGLEIWVDNGDAQVQAGELHGLADFGITSLNVDFQQVHNTAGDTLIQSQAGTSDGSAILTEDVWFGTLGNLSSPNLSSLLSDSASLDSLLSSATQATDSAGATAAASTAASASFDVAACLQSCAALAQLLDQSQLAAHA